MLKRLAMAIMVVMGAACASVPPATPTLVSIKGHGVASINATVSRPGAPDHNNVGLFQFDQPIFDLSTLTVRYYGGSQVVFTVPFPTTIEVAINGIPLTKVSPPPSPSDDYQYSGDITTVSNVATWTLGIRTPKGIPFNSSAASPNSYILTIVNVGASQRSQPLTIYYRNPLPPPPPPGSESVTSGAGSVA